MPGLRAAHLGAGTVASEETASSLSEEAGGVHSVVAVCMHWDDGPHVSLNLVTPPCEASVLAEQQAGDQDDTPGVILC